MSSRVINSGAKCKHRLCFIETFFRQYIIWWNIRIVHVSTICPKGKNNIEASQHTEMQIITLFETFCVHCFNNTPYVLQKHNSLYIKVNLLMTNWSKTIVWSKVLLTGAKSVFIFSFLFINSKMSTLFWPDFVKWIRL